MFTDLETVYPDLYWFAFGGENRDRPTDAFNNLRSFVEVAADLIAPTVGVDFEDVRLQLEEIRRKKIRVLTLNDQLYALARTLSQEENRVLRIS